jgi:hypothetical protein
MKTPSEVKTRSKSVQQFVTGEARLIRWPPFFVSTPYLGG